MLIFLMIMNLSMSLTFMFMTHPLSMGMILLIQSTLIAMITGFFSHNFWFSYILFLIMVGGMLVLFIYMTSIASNEMFHYSNKSLLMITIIMLLMMVLSTKDQFMINQYILNTETMMFNNLNSFKMSLNKYLNFPSNMMLLFMIIYLFITLVAVVKITNLKSGPLRKNL